MSSNSRIKAMYYIKQKMKNGDRPTPSSEYKKKQNSCNKKIVQSIFDVQEFSAVAFFA